MLRSWRVARLSPMRVGMLKSALAAQDDPPFSICPAIIGEMGNVIARLVLPVGSVQM